MVTLKIIPSALFFLILLFFTFIIQNFGQTIFDKLIYDQWMSSSLEPASDDIAIIAIDDESLAQYGRWPWPRGIQADLISAISKKNPSTIHIEIDYVEKSQIAGNDKKLRKVLEDAGNVYLPVYHGEDELEKGVFHSSAANVGHSYIYRDRDGVYRSAAAYVAGFTALALSHLEDLTFLDRFSPEHNPPVSG